MRRAGLGDAFDLRRNVVNLKKVLLHSWHAAEPLEKELRQLSTRARARSAAAPPRRPCPDPSPRASVSPRRKDPSYENGFVNIARHREICVAHMTCKGRRARRYDARVVAKQICCILGADPRRARQARAVTKIPHHPQLARTGTPRTRRGRNPGRTRGCLRRLCLLRLLRRPPPPSAVSASSGRLPLAAPGVRLPALARSPRSPALGFRERGGATSSTTSNSCVTARGGVKALAIRAETKLWASCKIGGEFVFAATRRLESTRRSVEEVLRDDVGARRCSFVTHGSSRTALGAIDALRAANRVDRPLNLARGVPRAALDVADAVARVCRDPAVRWFAAGDAARGTFLSEPRRPPSC